MKTIEQLMNTNVIYLHYKDTVDEAISIFKKTNVSNIPVIDSKKKVLGIINLRDLIGNNFPNTKLSQVINRNFPKVNKTDNITKLIKFFEFQNSLPIIVVDELDCLCGILSEKDLMHAFLTEYSNLKSILNSVNDGIVAVDENGKATYFNEKWLKIHRLDQKQVLGMQITNKLPETKLLKVLKSGKSLEEGPLFFKKTGATVIPSYKPLLYGKKVVGAVAIVQNMAEIKELTINLRELTHLNNYLSVVFNSLAEGVIAVDNKKKLIYANSAFKKMFKEKVDLNMDLPELSNEIDQVLEDETSIVSKEIRIEKNDFSIIFTCIPLTSYNNKVIGCMCIIQDVTDSKNLSRQLEKTKNLAVFYESQLFKNLSLKEDIVCKNAQFKKILAIAHKAAPTGVTILISGENGVGKEMIARFIHSNSQRNGKPFIAVNCSAIPETLWESEMFGYEEGAFTGSKKGGKPGKFELADGGTIFLDEIGEIPLHIQPKLLRVLHNMEIEKIGSTEKKKVDVRIIAATNQDLEQMVAKKLFREDLYYRLNVVRLHVPPLRERKEEILPLTKLFLKKFNKKYKKNVVLTNEVTQFLINHQWPGNIRELQNIIEHGVVLAEKEMLSVHLPQHMQFNINNNIENLVNINDVVALTDIIKEVEKQALRGALKKANFNKSKAMEILNISRRTFYKKLKEYNIK